MLYFLEQALNMLESHINSFRIHFLFICLNAANFRLVPISHVTVLLRYALLRWRRLKQWT